MVIATSTGKLLFLRLYYKKLSSAVGTLAVRGSHWTRNHGVFLHSNHHMEGAGEGREIEVVQVEYLQETAVMGGVVDMLSMGNQVAVTTGYGILHRLSWEGSFHSALAININHVPFANDLHPESRGQTLTTTTTYSRQICYSPNLRGFAVVLSDGRGAFLTSSSTRYEPHSMRGVWMKGMMDAVCVGVNAKYRLLAFGKTNGSVEVYSCDESTGEWSPSHTLQFTRSQFPDTGMLLGEVRCVEWSVPDGMCVAVSWKNGGLSLWSVFGSLLLCSLGDQPGTPSPLNPHCTILESLCWSSDGYHLWMLPIPRAEMKSQNRRSFGMVDVADLKESKLVLVMQFMRNSIVSNPILSNHGHLFLQGSDRLYLNTSYSHRRPGGDMAGGQTHTKVTPNNIGTISSPQWKVISLPATYMILNWPILYAAVSESGCNLGVAGRAGFALYSTSRRKWKLFGNEVQEQGLVCRGGMVWYHEVLIFPCRVQDKREEVRFYSLHSNLNNSQLLNYLRTTSPIIKINIYGNYLLLASHDCHVTIIGLNLEVLPNNGVLLSATKLHEMNLAKSLPSPWATSLVAMVPSSIRSEAVSSVQNVGSEEGVNGRACRHRAMDSILFNIGGRLFMLQQDLPMADQLMTREQAIDGEEEKEVWSFGSPVCLAASVEAIWIPPPPTIFNQCTTPTSYSLISRHVSESLWMACGWAGMKVWLPLFPRDEPHISFLSKRIMLTIPCPVYPQVVMFADAVLFGLSHETAFSEQLLATPNSFPFATIERTTNIFLHHILRQLLRRNLGGHALHIARSYSQLPYFSHVLELMLHEILEEEAPGSMPIPDALLPRVVDYIKQFPEFLVTVGHCARKTEVALWQYLFAAVGNPRDLFEWCVVDGQLQTAAIYLVIIQNLEIPSVSRQLATRLLDAALESNSWTLCKDLVRFLRAIGPGDAMDSPASSSLTPHKAHTPTSPPSSFFVSSSLPTSSMGTGYVSSSTTPDLDRSAILMTRDHLTSGSISATVNLCGDYKDASGKMIKRPQFVLDLDSREDYFMELILSRHARKLLTRHALRDLGRFTAHLDFPLHAWLVRESHRAACIEDFPTSLRLLHTEFHWPFPRTLCKESSPMDDEEAKEKPFLAGSRHTPKGVFTLDGDDDVAFTDVGDNPAQHIANESASSVKSRKVQRPPDLDLSPSNTIQQQHSVTLEPCSPDLEPSLLRETEFEHGSALCSTPAKHSGSVSEKVSLLMKKTLSSLDMDLSSMGEEGLEESEWDLNSDVAVVMGVGGVSRGSPQAEKEIRYFAGMMMGAGCLDWSVLLALLLLDSSLLTQTLEALIQTTNCSRLEVGVVHHILHGMKQLQTWAEEECPGYLHFLGQIQSLLKQLLETLTQQLYDASAQLGGDSQLVPTPTQLEATDAPTEVFTQNKSKRYSSGSDSFSTENTSSGCVLS